MLDALHVALASVAGCTMIVSWNFKHIVHFPKIPLYRAINVIKGYSQLDIIDPLKIGKTPHPTPHTLHPAPRKNFFSRP